MIGQTKIEFVHLQPPLSQYGDQVAEAMPHNVHISMIKLPIACPFIKSLSEQGGRSVQLVS